MVQAEGTACAKLLNEKEHESLAARAGDSVLAIRVGVDVPIPSCVLAYRLE